MKIIILLRILHKSGYLILINTFWIVVGCNYGCSIIQVTIFNLNVPVYHFEMVGLPVKDYKIMQMAGENGQKSSFFFLSIYTIFVMVVYHFKNVGPQIPLLYQ